MNATIDKKQTEVSLIKVKCNECLTIFFLKKEEILKDAVCPFCSKQGFITQEFDEQTSDTNTK